MRTLRVIAKSSVFCSPSPGKNNQFQLPVKKQIELFIFSLPALIGVSLGLGIWVGATLFGGQGRGKEMGASIEKFREVLGILDGEYVDTLDPNRVTENVLNHLLEGLDPHSSYIPQEDIELSHSSLESGFEGIGIEFLIVEDTVQVISALKGGPSDMVGILPGDRLFSANGVRLTGRQVSNREVFQNLRGKKGSTVELEIKRVGYSKLLRFSVVRSHVSSQSVEASFLINPKTGYLKISKFSDNTYLECKEALLKLKSSGAVSIILDVRDNPGGYLDRATRLVDEFLPENRLIVFTDGKAKKYDQQYFSSEGGIFQKEPLIVLVNEGSASASEILAGAIQDNDRGLILGRRTFGKGLVQVPISLKDGSELRLTISRYFSPSGRCIQKPYRHSDVGYNFELDKRRQTGELFWRDSIHPDKVEKFETLGGRTVYGGGGIIPDVFIPLDTLTMNPFLIALMQKNLFREFALSYFKKHEKELLMQKKRLEPSQLQLKPEVMKEFVEMTLLRKIDWPIHRQRIETESFLQHMIKAYIARLIWGDNGYYQIMCLRDPMIQTALRKMPEANRLFTQKLHKYRN
jgi:carboxyl-terminal processing protease